MVTRAISQVGDEGSKNLTLNLSTRIKNHKFYLMTSQNTKLPKTENIIYHHLYPESHVFIVSKIGLFNKLKLIWCMVSNYKHTDVYHFIFTPEFVSSLITRLFLKLFKKKSVQTISTPLPISKLKKCLFADKIVVLSEWTKKRVLDLGHENVVKIRPGIDLDKFSKKNIPTIRKKLGISEKDFVILFPGEYLIERGTRVILNILKRLVENFPYIKIIFACRPHKGDAKEKKFIIDTVNSFNLRNNIVFLDRIDFMPELINSSDIVILPIISPFFKMEIPMVLLESLALEKPIIISDIPPLNEIFLNKNVGVKVKVDDSEDLFNSIIKLIKDKSLRKRMGKEGRGLVEKEFDIIKIAEKYKQVYDELKLK